MPSIIRKGDEAVNIYDLRTEYQTDPIGLALLQPRFSWKITSDRNDTVQTAYRITVFQLPQKRCVWDSGRRESGQSVLIPYEGELLTDETEYLVRVSVQDNYGNEARAQGRFTTGMMDPTSFRAEMITHDFPEDETACPIFYRRFTSASSSKKIEKAWIYATAQGVYELTINGMPVSEDRMTPGWTSYHHRLQYQTYDVTDFLADDNRIEITVGNGWYKGILGFTCTPNHYGDRVAAFAELHIRYEDGTKEVLITDENWSVCTGEIRCSEIYMGETIDTDEPSIRQGKVRIRPFDRSILTAQENEPVRITQRIPAAALIRTPKGETVLDFGQNITGVAEVRVHGYKGQKIVVRHAETLDRDGNFYMETLRQAKSTDTYICRGGEQIFRPHFTFHGFRYIRVEGMEDARPEQFTACVMHSDLEKTGNFNCSNPKVNQLQSNINWGQMDNFLDIPTDCPQRDERLGWTGDAQIFSWTAAFNRNAARFFAKWMRDLRAESSLEEGVPHVVPDILGSYSSAAWSDAAVIIPWVIYQTYGDSRILSDNWTCMHEWVDYIRNHCGDNGLWQSGFQYGDWLALDKEESADRTGATDRYLVANAYYLYVTDLVSQTAGILGKKKEETYYRSLYEETREAFRREYYTETGRIVSETQTGCVLSLYFGLAREKDRERILDTLVTNIENHKNHLSTGFVGTPYLCHALSENGQHDLAAALFMKEDYPSWLYAVNMGATTIWERWNSVLPDGSFDESGMNSLNHYAYGSIGDWMYRKIAGLNQLEPGYRRFEVRPMFVSGIEEAGVEFESVYGRIESRWSCRAGRIHVTVVVPPNTQAVIYLPERPEEEALTVGSGRYEYEYETSTCLAHQRFSLDSTWNEILSQPLAVKLMEQAVPGFTENPMLALAQQMTLAETIAASPEAKPLYEAVVNALNDAERNVP